MSSSTHPSRHALPGVVVPAQLDYAIRGLVTLALADRPRTKVEVLASEHGLSRKFLAQVLAELRDAGIVNTQRGSDGGYSLARPLASIRLIEVFDALSPAPAGESGPDEGPLGVTVAADAWATLAGAIRDVLARITLADLVEPALTGSDRIAGGSALEPSDPAGELRRGGREEIVAPGR